MALSDSEIIQRVFDHKMIDPFVDKQITHIEYGGGKRKKVISYGLSSYGYDIRLSNKFSIFSNVLSREVDPKNFDVNSLIQVATDEHVLIPPNSFLLGVSHEYIAVPRDILVLCVGKSTYARCGIVVNVTPLEPEWHGNITMEISNTTPLPARIYANEGICQLIFLEGRGCDVSYADKNGKYQGQTGVMPPFI